MRKLKITAFCILAAVCYGVVHDLITAHLCVEYFTLAHPPLFHTQSPTLLALCWGVAATIGPGMIFGAALASVAVSGGVPPYPFVAIRRSVLAILATMALSAFLAGTLGFELSSRGVLSLPNTFAEVIPRFAHDRFMAVWFAHCASYLAGFAESGILIWRIWKQRGKPAIFSLAPTTPLAIARSIILAGVAILIVYVRFFR